ncbi:hypothetical protein HOF92_17045, partial [bacterium]|nr:hypothetical protein [bacterium]
MRKLIQFFYSIVFLFGLFMTTSFAGSRALTSGWNLVSLPVSGSTDVANTISGLNVGKIWTYDGAWLKHVPGETNTGNTRFANFEPNRGYWFFMNDTGTLNWSDSETIRALALDTGGWALVSFNQTSNLDISTQVLSDSNFDASHAPNNISKVWEYSGTWASYSPASSGSSDLQTVSPGFAYWFFVKSGEDGASEVSASSVMTITPVGSSATDDAVLVLGGATSLVPPDAQTAAAIRGKVPRFARFSMSRFATTAAASSHETDTMEMSCDNASDEGKIIGWAHLFSIEGEDLTTPASIMCGSNPTAPLDFEFRLKKEDAERIREQRLSCVIDIDLNSGQGQQLLVPMDPIENLPDDLDSIVGNPNQSTDNDTSSTSTLGVGLLSQELANKLGHSPEQFKLGTPNSGLGEIDTSIRDTTNESSDDGIDLHELNNMFTQGASDPNSLFYDLVRTIDSVNDAASLTDTTRVNDRGDEINRILTGESDDSNNTTFTAKLDQLKRIGSLTNELLTSRRTAERKGIIEMGAGNDEHGKIGDLIGDILMQDENNHNLLDVGEVLNDSLGMSNETSNDASLSNITRSQACSFILSAHSIRGSLGTSDTTRAMELIGQGLNYSDDAVQLLADNPGAGENFARIIGKGLQIHERAKEEDQKKPLDDRQLDDLGELTSIFENGSDLFGVLLENADDEDAQGRFLAGATEGIVSGGEEEDDGTGAGSDDSKNNASARLFEIVSDQEEKGNINAADALGNAAEKIGGPNASGAFQTLARNAPDASSAANILNKGKDKLPEKALGKVLEDDKLKNDFALDNKILPSAGSSRKIRIKSDLTNLTLDASGSFDPKGSTLYYQWFEIDASGNESTINTTGSTANIKISTSIDT